MAITERKTSIPDSKAQTAESSSKEEKEAKVEREPASGRHTERLSVVEYFNEYGWPPPDQVLDIMRSVGLGKKLTRPPSSVKKQIPQERKV